jgi:hypothetical protein
MAQYLAINDRPEDDLAKAAAAAPDAVAGTRTPAVRADCCKTSIKNVLLYVGLLRRTLPADRRIVRPLATGLVSGQAAIRLGVGTHPGIAVAALELTARTARTRVVPPDAGEIVVGAWPLAGFHVRSAVHGRRRVLQSLRPTRGEPRRYGGGRGGPGRGPG